MPGAWCVLHGGQGTVSVDDSGDVRGFRGAVAVAAHDVPVLSEFLLNGGVAGLPFTLDVDQKLQAAVPMGINAVALVPHQPSSGSR
jgi:hypothetical protein